MYLHAYSKGWKAEISLASFLWRYCHARPHSPLGGRTPREVYTEAKPFLPSGVNDIRGKNRPINSTHHIDGMISELPARIWRPSSTSSLAIPDQRSSEPPHGKEHEVINRIHLEPATLFTWPRWINTRLTAWQIACPQANSLSQSREMRH